MPQIKFAPAAVRDLERLRDFLRVKNPAAAKRAGASIMNAIRLMGTQPESGRPISDLPAFYREWIIGFGNSGYVVRYRFENDSIIILAIRHQREVGF